MDASRTLKFDNISYHVRSDFSRVSRKILRDISGSFRFGEVSAIVGPSGCGKTSLLNILSGYESRNVQGSVKINENDVSTKVLRDVSSYVMQEYVLHDYLTVHETLMFAASFRIENSFKKHARVENILNALRMSDRKNTYVKSISGGEKKRLSIAIELVDDPRIIFLDEPITGLDSSSAMQSAQLLKTLAQAGKAVIITVHAPSALLLNQFDHIYALADGCCIYQGSCQNLVPFLKELNFHCHETFNPADYLLELVMNDCGQERLLLTEKIKNGKIEKYRKFTTQQIIASNDLKPSQSQAAFALSFSKQVKHLMQRSFLISVRDVTLLAMRLVINIVISVSMGLLYFGVGNDATQFMGNYRYLQSMTMVPTFLSFSSLLTASENSKSLCELLITRNHFSPI